MYQLAFDCYQQHEETYWWYVARRRIVRDWIGRYSAGRRGRALDYGCGTGSYAQMLQAMGFEVDAADNDPRSLDLCRARGITSTHNLNERRPQEDRYNLVLMLDVLEHVEDDVACCKSCRSWLTGSGRSIVAVPALRWLWSGEDYISKHIRRYTRKSLVSVLERGGLTVERCSYFNTFLFLPYAAVILARKLFGARYAHSSNYLPLPRPINTALTGLFGLESHVLRLTDMPFGASLIAVARK
jgi:SAM-dependent methyltransferase